MAAFGKPTETHVPEPALTSNVECLEEVADQARAVVAVADRKIRLVGAADPARADGGQAGGVEWLAVELLRDLETRPAGAGQLPEVAHLLQRGGGRRLGGVNRG